MLTIDHGECSGEPSREQLSRANELEVRATSLGVLGNSSGGRRRGEKAPNRNTLSRG